VIVTQDVDFAELAALLGSPPKVIWPRAGNQTTATISALLRRHARTIQAFEGDDDAACLEIY
jgi:predicted nuclease of predicted toxin-antitoxin system